MTASTMIWALAFLAQLTVIVLWQTRRLVASLPQSPRRDPAPPDVVLVKVVLEGDRETIDRCKTWIESARAYPGNALVVISTIRDSRKQLETLEEEGSNLRVSVVSTSAQDRIEESGLDKARRLIATEPTIGEFLRDRDGVLVLSDEDTSAAARDVVERLVAATPNPGTITSVLYPVSPAGGERGWTPIVGAGMQFNNAIYALGARLFDRLQAVFLGWTTVVWASDLSLVGGFAAAAESISEDASLGRLLAAQKIRTRLFASTGVIEIDEERTFLDLWKQQVRWRAQLRSCHLSLVCATNLFLPLVSANLLAIAVLILDPGIMSVGLVLSSLVVGLGLSGLSARRFWLLPLHELLVSTFQIVGMTTGRLRWGSFEYSIDRRARIVARRWLRTSATSKVSQDAGASVRVEG